jgi:hypothetical protein
MTARETKVLAVSSLKKRVTKENVGVPGSDGRSSCSN